MKITPAKIIGGFTLLFFIGGWWLAAKKLQENAPYQSGLPYYGYRSTDAISYHVSPFSLLDQDSAVLTRETFEDNIWITDFFFSTCDGICPKMNANMMALQDSLAKDTHVLFLSHTVDPETDHPSVLKKYAERHHAIKGKWYFVTGQKETLYDLARNSYFIAGPKDSTTTAQEDFVHSQLFALIDPHLHIRGYYDGTNTKDMSKLIKDIRQLQLEYPQAK